MSRGLKIIILVTIAVIVMAFVLGIFHRDLPDVFAGNTLGLLRVEGVITDVDWYMEQVNSFRTNDRVKGVVLRIDSPGGAVAPTQELYDELLKLKSKKPLVVSMGTVAASGGYYLSCASDWIVANPGTITGSIGVIMEFTNMEELFGKLGIRNETIKSGAHKDMGSPFRELTKEERTLLTEMVKDVREQFVEAVVAGRPVEFEKINPYLDGRIFTGRQALNLGLVDELGNINVALEKAAELAGLPGVPSKILEPKKRGRGLIALLFGRSFTDQLETVTLAWAQRGGVFGKNSRFLQLWRAF
ncbi:MAG: signal peptide peptidase SppA [Deltaproteobacteria bacterium]|nr:signal peptide peptidase SppA [Deltaproteobacteria bacterium]